MAFRLDPARPLADEFTRLVDEGVDAIVRHLETASSDHSKGLHEARKTIKKLRALLHLFLSAPPETSKTAELRFRDAARAIAGPREATAAVETLDRLISTHPKRIAECRLDEIRAVLVRRRDAVADAGLGDAIEKALATCLEARAALDGLPPESNPDEGTLARGMKKTLKRWRRALDGAERHGAPDDFHDLRKAVKAHWAQRGLLRDCLPGGFGKRRKALDELGERLGELNDIHVMHAALGDGSLGISDGIDTGGFDGLLKKEAKRLSKTVLAEAGRLLDKRPKKLAQRLRKTRLTQRPKSAEPLTA